MTTLLSICQDAAGLIGLRAPSSVAAATADFPLHLKALVNLEGRYLMRTFEWPVLIDPDQETITTVDGTKDYTFPADFDRVVQGSFWDVTNSKPIKGPDSQAVHAYINNGLGVQAGTGKRFTLQGSAIRIWPTPTAAETLKYKYVSKYWVRAAAGTPKELYTLDTDTTVLDPLVLTLGVVYRYRRAKRLDAQSEWLEYQSALTNLQGAVIGGDMLDLNDGPHAMSDYEHNIPETGYSTG
jgi:hypothetical protein